MGVKIGEISEIRRVEDKEKINNNEVLLEHLVEVYGICRGVCVKETMGGATYRGILERANGELVPFGGYSSLESTIAKTSSETSKPVSMQCIVKKDTPQYRLSVEGLKLAGIQSFSYKD